MSSCSGYLAAMVVSAVEGAAIVGGLGAWVKTPCTMLKQLGKNSTGRSP
jgi:hypothetical protein